ncbi:MAG: sulfite exporter TauE/SafE family protein [Chloroflexi bacterium]|nr:sulfite exporter TauE/SafE family protein [Chloroflexota bacterium]
MAHFLWLIPLGLIIGAYGTLIGAGGGFLLMPILLLLYPHESPELLTSISLAVVFFNALSGSAAYARMKRIDYRSGLLFSTATVPGAILGALTTAYMPRRLFDGVFGLLMIAVSAYLLLRPGKEKEPESNNLGYRITRRIIDGDSVSHAYSYNPAVGVGLSLFVGYVSSLLGIGGGIIHVPALVYFLNFPVHIATATSHFILAIMALTGTLVHIATGIFSHGVRRTIFLAIGVLLGAQLGARLSTRFHGKRIIQGLAIALGFVGIRILIMAL